MYKLDLKNIKIIECLIEDCRQSIVSISKKVGLSRESVITRLKKLEKENIITGYTCEINFNKLGFNAYSISIKLQNITIDEINKIIEKLINMTKLVFLEKTLSKYDLVGTLIVQTKYELETELNLIRTFLGTHLRFIDIDIFLGEYDFLNSLFSKKSKPFTELNFFDKNIATLDKQDKKIIKILTENSRQSIIEIATQMDLSVFSIAKRIKKLYNNNIIIAFRPIINFEKLNLHRYTLILNFSDQKNEKSLIEYCRQQENIWSIGKFIGNYNFAVELFAENNESFKESVLNLVGKFSKSIIEYETLIVLKELKHNYFFLN